MCHCIDIIPVRPPPTETIGIVVAMVAFRWLCSDGCQAAVCGLAHVALLCPSGFCHVLALDTVESSHTHTSHHNTRPHTLTVHKCLCGALGGQKSTICGENNEKQGKVDGGERGGRRKGGGGRNGGKEGGVEKGQPEEPRGPGQRCGQVWKPQSGPGGERLGMIPLHTRTCWLLHCQWSLHGR